VDEETLLFLECISKRTQCQTDESRAAAREKHLDIGAHEVVVLVVLSVIVFEVEVAEIGTESPQCVHDGGDEMTAEAGANVVPDLGRNSPIVKHYS
jgi:hypothetical protein